MESKIEKAVGKAIKTFLLGLLHNPFERPSWAFWGTHQGEANGPPQRANRKLFEAVRPSFCDLVSEPADGSESSCK
jgi:hypothetical protein